MTKDYDETKIAPLMTTRAKMPIANASVAIFHLGDGVVVKAKRIGMGGTGAEANTLQLIRELKPEVPVPEPLYHWKDPDWFTYFTIIREASGVELDAIWWGLTEETRQRLMKEAAEHLQSVGHITSPLAICADGTPSYGGWITYTPFGDENEEPRIMPGPFTPKKLHEFVSKNFVKTGRIHSIPTLEEWGKQFHLCPLEL